MAKVLIDIPDEEYNLIKMKLESNIGGVSSEAERVIAKGIPLPKGHGRLIDADELKAEFQQHHDLIVDAYGGFRNMPIEDKSRVDEITASIASIVNAQTIIEPHKEVDNG